MSFADSLSKLAKSIEDGLETATKKAGDSIEITKLNGAIKNEEEKIKNLYVQIGEVIYKKFVSGEHIDSEFIENCNKINELNNNIVSIKHKISQIKNVKVCTGCSTELNDDIVFCPKCGKKQEIQKVEVEEVKVEEVRKCPACGAEILGDSLFCTSCGSKISE